MPITILSSKCMDSNRCLLLEVDNHQMALHNKQDLGVHQWEWIDHRWLDHLILVHHIQTTANLLILCAQVGLECMYHQDNLHSTPQALHLQVCTPCSSILKVVLKVLVNTHHIQTIQAAIQCHNSTVLIQTVVHQGQIISMDQIIKTQQKLRDKWKQKEVIQNNLRTLNLDSSIAHEVWLDKKDSFQQVKRKKMKMLISKSKKLNQKLKAKFSTEMCLMIWTLTMLKKHQWKMRHQ